MRVSPRSSCPASPATRRPHARTRGAVFALTLLLAGGLFPALARVSMRIPPDSHAARVGAFMGWELAQLSEMDFGGIRGEAVVWSADGSVHSITERLRQFYTQAGQSNVFYNGEAMAWGLATDGTDIHRYLMADAGPGRGLQVYQMRQDARATPRPARGEGGHRLTAVPVYPGSTPGLFIADLTRGTSTEVSSTPADAASVLGGMASRAESAGWKSALPAGGSSLVYTRGREIMMVSVYTTPGEIRHIVRVHSSSTSADLP